MLERVGQFVEDSTSLLEARGRVLIHRARRAGVYTAVMIAAALAAAAGALTLVAALVVALVEPLGTAAALAVGGGLLVAAAVGTGAYIARRGPDEEEEKLQLQAALARDHLRRAFAAPEPGALKADLKSRGLAALQSAAKNPAAIALAVGALLAALVNAKRVTRFGRFVALTGVASTLAGAVREVVRLVERMRETHARGNGAVKSERTRAARTPVRRQ